MSSTLRSRAHESAKPRVVLTITRLIVGGAQLVVLGICQSLKDEFDIHVVCGPDGGSEGSIRAEVERHVPVTVLPQLRRDIHPLHDLASVARLRALYRRLDPDLVHSHSSKAGIVSRFATGSRPRVVHTVHGWGHTPVDPPWKQRVLVGLERMAAARTNALVVVSPEVAEEGLARGIGSRGLYRVILPDVDFHPRSRDFQEARRRARLELGVEAGDRVIGWVGRFVPQKDPSTLAAVLSRLMGAAGNGSTRAVLVGDGPLRAETEAELSRLGARVVFAGLRRDVRELYPAFDVLLQPSRWEGRSLVVQEALAEGIPVVATRVSGVSDLVSDGVQGFVVDPGDVGGLERRVTQVLEDPRLRAPLPAPPVEAERAGDRTGDAQLATLYRELIAQARAAP